MKIEFRHGLILTSLLLLCSCSSTIRQQKIEIPPDVASKTRVKELPKEKQVQDEKITVPAPKKDEPQQVAPQPKAKQKKKGKPFVAAKPELKVVNNPFKVGEIIKWDLYYIGIKAATMTVEIMPFVDIDGKKAFHFNGVAQTTSLMKYIYRLYDIIDSYVDYESFLPKKLTIKMDESKQNVAMVLNYDHKKGKSHFWKKRIDANGVATEERREDEFTPYAQDIFSSLYYMRTHDMKVGDKVKFVVHDNGKNWEMTIEVLKEEKVWTRLGSVDTLLLHPTVERNGEKFTKGKLMLWVTNDAKKVPVKYEAELRIGSMKGNIKDYIVPKQ
jgi:hypothetical protein